jgi:LEA14-like dessication related protein
MLVLSYLLSSASVPSYIASANEYIPSLDVSAMQYEATKKHSERHELVSQEEIGNSNGLIEIFSISGVKDDQKRNDIYVYDKLHEGEKRLKTEDSSLYDHARSIPAVFIRQGICFISINAILS